MAQITARTIVKSNAGVVVVGAKVYAKMIVPPVSGAFDDTKREIVSIAGGIVDFTLIETGATYLFWRGRSNPIRYRIPDDATTPHTLPGLIGNDSVDACDT